ncbi:MAG TPA: enoyl-CoA hydratase-related protein [Acidimicrobiia bacterium]|nr:enoyl-CoA hydratase-related protein [Acidimicrobiia bacterium]
MLRYDVVAPRATITIDDPERRNPLSNAVMTEMAVLIGRAAADGGVRVIVITGAGDQAFSAGGDLSGGFVETSIADHDARGALGVLLRAMRRCGKPTVARVNGHALAGGFGLAAACDVVIAVKDATFGTPEIKVGLWPMMITAVLQRVMPHKAALELMMSGRRITAEEAMRLGVVSRVVKKSDLDDAVDLVVSGLASMSPAVLRLGRDAFYAVEDLDFDTAVEQLHLGLTAVAATDDAAEGVSAFLEKRRPEWRGR